MATANRPGAAVRLTRDDKMVQAFYASLPAGDERTHALLDRVMAGEVRIDAQTARIREAALHVVEVDPESFSAECRAYGEQILKRTGRKSGPPIKTEGAAKVVTATFLPRSKAERERFARIAKQQGFPSLAAWVLSVVTDAADAAERGNENGTA